MRYDARELASCLSMYVWWRGLLGRREAADGEGERDGREGKGGRILYKAFYLCVLVVGTGDDWGQRRRDVWAAGRVGEYGGRAGAFVPIRAAHRLRCPPSTCLVPPPPPAAAAAHRQQMRLARSSVVRRFIHGAINQRHEGNGCKSTKEEEEEEEETNKEALGGYMAKWVCFLHS